jgi:hypothetical protein
MVVKLLSHNMLTVKKAVESSFNTFSNGGRQKQIEYKRRRHKKGTILDISSEGINENLFYLVQLLAMRKDETVKMPEEICLQADCTYQPAVIEK